MTSTMATWTAWTTKRHIIKSIAYKKNNYANTEYSIIDGLVDGPSLLRIQLLLSMSSRGFLSICGREQR